MTDFANAKDHPANVLPESLREYEANHDVTFVALDNATLADVIDAYARLDTDDTMQATNDFERAVRDLLGLDDAI